MGIDQIIFALATLTLMIDVLLLFMVVRSFHEISEIAKKLSEIDLYRFLYEDDQTETILEDASNLKSSRETTSKNYYRNKEGKLSFRVYNDNKRFAEAKKNHVINICDEFEELKRE